MGEFPSRVLTSRANARVWKFGKAFVRVFRQGSRVWNFGEIGLLGTVLAEFWLPARVSDFGSLEKFSPRILSAVRVQSFDLWKVPRRSFDLAGLEKFPAGVLPPLGCRVSELWKVSWRSARARILEFSSGGKVLRRSFFLADF